MGLIRASPEDLLLAAQYQYDLKIDVSEELSYLCTQPEVPPRSGAKDKNAESDFDRDDFEWTTFDKPLKYPKD